MHCVAIDKLDKIGMEGVRKELAQRGIADEAAARLLQSMADAPQGNSEIVPWLANLLHPVRLAAKVSMKSNSCSPILPNGPAADRLQNFNPYLARGLSCSPDRSLRSSFLVSAVRAVAAPAAMIWWACLSGRRFPRLALALAWNALF